MTEYYYFFETLLIQLLIIPILYAETHYQFRYFFSYLKKKEPEIIADIPSRITSGSLIPVLIIIKDADKFPVIINQITVYEKKKTIFSQEVNKSVMSSYKDLIFHLPSTEITNGDHFFDIEIRYMVKGKRKKCISDNHRGTSHKSLPLFISQDPLPRFDNCYLGETHSHTNYTSDQVEFGASLEATRTLAKAMGLDFFCATDHSYDLDDSKDNYLLNDPNLSKWSEFQSEVEKINQQEKEFLIIPGEEVTVRNNQDKNVHLLIYNSKIFFPGAGDSGEKWLHNRSELSISEVVSQISGTTMAASAHPSETPPLLQRWLINRGSWQSQDCAETGLHGLQFINGGESSFLKNGKNLWIEQLLSNNRLTGIAGNDAHGNFARFRQIGFPFLTMRENYNHLFGKWLTGIYIADDTLNIPSALNALKSGNCYMTNGPALLLQLENKDRSYVMGEECHSPERGRIMIRSNQEIGKINKVKIFLGDLAKKTESVYHQMSLEKANIDYASEIPLTNLPDRGYIRVEVLTIQNYQALSNPVWFRH